MSHSPPSAEASRSWDMQARESDKSVQKAKRNSANQRTAQQYREVLDMIACDFKLEQGANIETNTTMSANRPQTTTRQSSRRFSSCEVLARTAQKVQSSLDCAGQVEYVKFCAPTWHGRAAYNRQLIANATPRDLQQHPLTAALECSRKQIDQGTFPSLRFYHLRLNGCNGPRRMGGVVVVRPSPERNLILGRASVQWKVGVRQERKVTTNGEV
eukprot:1634822-Rhodomonas_salina.2